MPASCFPDDVDGPSFEIRLVFCPFCIGLDCAVPFLPPLAPPGIGLDCSLFNSASIELFWTGLDWIGMVMKTQNQGFEVVHECIADESGASHPRLMCAQTP